MEDKILQVKNEMKRIASAKDLTRLEQHDLMKDKSGVLSEGEKRILIKECYRDYESCDRIKDVTELITIFLTGLTLILTLVGSFAKDTFSEKALLYMLVLIVIYIVLAIIMVTWLQIYRSRNMNREKYVIDVLEE